MKHLLYFLSTTAQATQIPKWQTSNRCHVNKVFESYSNSNENENIFDSGLSLKDRDYSKQIVVRIFHWKRMH